jgi:hypothetical protein
MIDADAVGQSPLAVVSTATIRNSAVSHDELLHLESMVEAASREGYRLRRVPLLEWLAALGAAGSDFVHLQALWSGSAGSGDVERRYDRSAAKRVFGASRLALPKLDEALLRRYVRARGT